MGTNTIIILTSTTIVYCFGVEWTICKVICRVKKNDEDTSA